MTAYQKNNRFVTFCYVFVIAVDSMNICLVVYYFSLATILTKVTVLDQRTWCAPSVEIDRRLNRTKAKNDN
jgi:hypothetical protein